MLQRLFLTASIACALSATAGAQCLSTLFAANNGGVAGWACYVDVTCTTAVTIPRLECNFDAGGLPVGVEIYTTQQSYQGLETDPTAWTLVAVDDGLTISNNPNIPTPINLMLPFTLPPGLTGLAIVHLGSGPDYTNGGTSSLSYTDGTLTIDLGSSCTVPFDPSGMVFSPRMWNGTLCYGGSGGGLGTPYCGPAVANSTGSPAMLRAAGSTTVTDNSLTLIASGLPANQFGFFLNSQTQGFVPMPGGSQGNICLAGAVGRYNANIFNSGAAGSGSLLLDLANTPTPTGPVAIQAGQTWNFQCWYRDLNPGAASNFTPGLEVNFQ